MRARCVLENTILKQKTPSKIKYQGIIYYKDDRDESISPFEERPVDFILAMSEMEKNQRFIPKNKSFIQIGGKLEIINIPITKNK